MNNFHSNRNTKHNVINTLITHFVLYDNLAKPTTEGAPSTVKDYRTNRKMIMQEISSYLFK